MAKSRNAKDILDGLKNGITFLSSTADGPELRMVASTSTGLVQMGKTISQGALGHEVNFSISVSNARSFIDFFPYSVVLVTKNGIPFRFTLNKNNSYNFSFSDTPEENDYYQARLIQLPSDFSVRLLSQLLQIGWVKAMTAPIGAF